jgi:hypothetical protein
VRFPSLAASDCMPQWERRAARRQIVRRVLLGLGVLCLIGFGIIGALIGNSASPDTSATAAPAIRYTDWHGVPLHPDAVLLKTLSIDSSEYTVLGDTASVGDWFEREWTAIGLHAVESTSLDGATYRWFEVPDGIRSDQGAGFRTSGHIFGYRRFGYAVTPSEAGSCTITLIRMH